MKTTKRYLALLIAGCSALVLLNGCLALQFGGGDKPPVVREATVGEQLLDLKAARDGGAITEAEYEAKKARLLRGN